jgi:hypothetical protein
LRGAARGSTNSRSWRAGLGSPPRLRGMATGGGSKQGRDSTSPRSTSIRTCQSRTLPIPISLHGRLVGRDRPASFRGLESPINHERPRDCYRAPLWTRWATRQTDLASSPLMRATSQTADEPLPAAALDMRAYALIMRVYARWSLVTGADTMPSFEGCDCSAARAAARRLSRCDKEFLAPMGVRTTPFSDRAILKGQGGVADRRRGICNRVRHRARNAACSQVVVEPAAVNRPALHASVR